MNVQKNINNSLKSLRSKKKKESVQTAERIKLTKSVALYKGHRSRLRKRLLNKGESALDDYELLEMLLGFAQPRKDTKPLAKSLLNIFKYLSNIVCADPIALKRVEGVGESIAAILKLAHGISVRILKNQIKETPCLDNIDKVINYARASIGYIDKEVSIIFFLDTKNYLLDTEMRFTGTIDQVSTYPREILQKALELKAKSFIMVHNHPSGELKPSREDLDLTRDILKLAYMMDIILYDHIIVSRNGFYSMKRHGHL